MRMSHEAPMLRLSVGALTLADSVWPSGSSAARVWRSSALIVVGSLLLTLSAKLQIPFWPVPMTMQTFAVAVISMACGWRLGVATVIFYLAQGALGLPVFAGTPERGVGLAYMAGPTGGYLIGFALCAALLGWLAERGWDRDWLTAAGAMAIGHAVIFAAGLGWLATHVGAARAIDLGLTPFWTATALKIGLGVAVMPLAWRLVGRRSHRA